MLNYKIGESYKITEQNCYHYSILYNIKSNYLHFKSIDTYNNNGIFIGKYNEFVIKIGDEKYFIEKLYNDENV